MPAKTVTNSSGELRRYTLLFLGFVIALSYLTYFHRYWYPQAVFWDENYHIASAQKYLHGVYFMEQHPPLGKLLIALGEVILHPNERTDQFLGTDYGTDFGGDFSFVGYRFFSALLGWWTAPVLFLIFLILLRNPLHSTLLSFLYIFDNAFIVHLRGAMLEGPLMFFVALVILFFLLLLRDRENMGRFMLWSILMGVSFALVISTKVLGLICILFVLPVLFVLLLARRSPNGEGGPRWKKMLGFLLCFSIPFTLLYGAIWEIHFALGRTVNPALPDNGYYQASQEYKEILDSGRTATLSAFPILLRDSLRFVSHYNNGAPRLDLCKEDENGSPFYFWPLGARTINFRWETPEGKSYRYLYLVPNPVVWWSALAALVIAVSMLICSVVMPPHKPMKHRFLLCVFLGIYLCFMIAMSRITRVLYLYHYFIPLFLSFIVLGLVFDELQAFRKRVLDEYGKTVLAVVLAGIIFAAHQFYRPLTYYQPLTDVQFNRRNIFGLWDMHCVSCPRNNGLVIPTK